jgi:hypothetical protein
MPWTRPTQAKSHVLHHLTYYFVVLLNPSIYQRQNDQQKIPLSRNHRLTCAVNAIGHLARHSHSPFLHTGESGRLLSYVAEKPPFIP